MFSFDFSDSDDEKAQDRKDSEQSLQASRETAAAALEQTKKAIAVAEQTAAAALQQKRKPTTTVALAEHPGDQYMGTWQYGRGQRFSISRSCPGSSDSVYGDLHFRQYLSKGGHHLEGKLRPSRSGYSAELFRESQEEVAGTIHLRFCAQTEDLRTNFQKPAKTSLEQEIVAQRISHSAWVQRPSDGAEWFRVVFPKVLVKRSPDPDEKSWGFVCEGELLETKACRAVDAQQREWVELTASQMATSFRQEILHATVQCGFVLIDGISLGLPQLLEGPLHRSECLQSAQFLAAAEESAQARNAREIEEALGHAEVIFKTVQGYVEAGNDLLVEKMTVAQAKARCMSLVGCYSFTFAGEDTEDPVLIFFKGKTRTKPGAWTSYIMEVNDSDLEGKNNENWELGTGHVWTVSGDMEAAGVTVYRGSCVLAARVQDFLSMSACLEEIEHSRDMVHYRLVDGYGPPYGWISRKDCYPQSNQMWLPPAPRANTWEKHWQGELPAESQHWSSFEEDLFVFSGGRYHPGEMAKRRIPISGVSASLSRVSIVTPTSDARRVFHTQLLNCFAKQAWQDKELIIIETTSSRVGPSQMLQAVAAEHGNMVVYVSIQASLSIGLKRNMGLHLATGKYIVQFDDDDMYAPCYVERMVKTMSQQHLIALTLSAWYNCDLIARRIEYVDPLGIDPTEEREASVAHIVFGYGFSYAYLREIAIENAFPDCSLSEDYIFLSRLRRTHGPEKVGLLRDTSGICLHLKHGHNTSDVDKNRDATRAEIEGLKVWGLDVLNEDIRRMGPQKSPQLQ